ncbi:hypothetical protein PtB15_2B451 [Puccinia triticina]|nr:hypothetical protein PtB15_2B451 [Puccinia triticina]
MSDQFEEVLDEVRRLAQLSSGGTPEAEDQAAQQTVTKNLTNKTTKSKKSKTTARQGCLPRSPENP